MLTACERSCWMTLLSFASVAEDGGRVKYLSEPQLMTAANVSPMHEEWDLTVGVLKKFEELGMIEQSNGIITVKNWGKRQESYLTNAQRQARFRDKRKSNAEITDVLLQSNARIEENRIEENNTSKSSDLQITKEITTEVKKKADTAYRGVFELWGKYPLNWQTNRTEIQAAKNLLEEHSLEGVEKALTFAKRFKDDPFCPEVTTPYDLDSKWGKLLAFKNKRA